MAYPGSRTCLCFPMSHTLLWTALGKLAVSRLLSVYTRIGAHCMDWTESTRTSGPLYSPGDSESPAKVEETLSRGRLAAPKRTGRKARLQPSIDYRCDECSCNSFER